MIRSKSLTTAAVILFLYSLLQAVLEVPNLARGTFFDSNTSMAPFAMSLFSFTLALAGLFAAYGVWKNMRWGKVLAIVVLALRILYTSVPVLVAPLPIKIIGLVFIAIAALILVLLLGAPRRQTA